jgi:hypothetical protein
MRKGQGTGAEVLNPGESGIGGSNPGERAMGCAPPRCTRPLADPQSPLPTSQISSSDGNCLPSVTEYRGSRIMRRILSGEGIWRCSGVIRVRNGRAGNQIMMERTENRR